MCYTWSLNSGKFSVENIICWCHASEIKEFYQTIIWLGLWVPPKSCLVVHDRWMLGWQWEKCPSMVFVTLSLFKIMLSYTEDFHFYLGHSLSCPFFTAFWSFLWKFKAFVFTAWQRMCYTWSLNSGKFSVENIICWCHASEIKEFYQMIIWLGIGIVGSAKKLFGWDCLCRRFRLFCFCLTCFSAGSSFF